MQRIILLSAALMYSIYTHAQHSLQLKNLWAEPTVHVLFEGYTVSFTVKDINKALQLLAESGDSTFGITSELDTGKQYTMELYPGYNTQYHDKLQPLLQRGIGAYLLTMGHAEIESPRHKRLKNVIVDIQLSGNDEGNISDVKFYDQKTGMLLFNGMLPATMYNKDLGID